MYTVNNLPDSICLDHQSEDHVLAFQFDFNEWADEYGTGSFFIKHQRAGDANPYVVPTVSIEGNTATWTVSDTDTAVNGIGEAELNYVGEDFHKKSDRFNTFVSMALGPHGSIPDPEQDWLDQLAGLRDEAVQAAEAAEGYAEQASQAFEFIYDDGRLTIRRATNG